MICANWSVKLDAYLDGELTSTQTAEVEKHLRECPGCTSEGAIRMQWKRAVRSAGQRYAPGFDLRERVRKSIAAPNARSWRARGWRGVAVPVLALLLVGAGFLLQQNRGNARDQEIASELVDLHIATLASSTPVDVISSDKHTVKPWFEGKIPFTFNLPDLNGSSFELVGGRVTSLHQAAGAELVFRLRKHQITAFIFRDEEHGFPQSGPARSFHLVSWNENGLRYFLVGDVSLDDLRSLQDLFRKAQ